jgi:hypothetical protein
MKRELLLFLAFITLCTLTQGADGAEQTSMLLVLKANAPVYSPFVSIGDVVEIPHDPLRIRTIVSAIFLGLSPSEGDVRHITRQEIRERLADCGIPLGKTRFEGTDEVVLFRGSSGSPSASQPSPSRLTVGTSKPPTTQVQEGTTVILRADHGTLQIEEPARALKSGNKGDLVEVENKRTKKQIVARVAGPGLVVPIERPGSPLED